MLNGKKIVGIVPSASLFRADNIYGDNYIFVNSYIKRVEESGAIALGLLANDGYINTDIMQVCDAILICGGLQIHPYHFQAVDYAYNNNIPILGICLGLQAIHCYFVVRREAKVRNFNGNLLDLYLQMKKENYMFVLPVENHWPVHLNRHNLQATRHIVNINVDSRAYSIFKSDKILASSMHRYAINSPSNELSITGFSEDGSIEIIEHKNSIIAVQFHPEVDTQFKALFDSILSI